MSGAPSGIVADWIGRPVESGSAAGFGLYLHVPFCRHRCGYCDFATFAVGDGDDERFGRYMGALEVDLDRWQTKGSWPEVTSVFIGGGTPTMVGADRLERLLGEVRSRFRLAPDVEISVEANPETASIDLFATLAHVGVTRVSIGAQSFAPHVLAQLERGHAASRIVEAVTQARRGGVPAISLDLIYGTPGERDEDWAATLRAVLELEIDHVSAYALSIHANTPFGRAVTEGTMRLPDDDVLRDRFELARSALGMAGFEHYELSNFARGTGQRSRHNSLYWRHGDYLGIGVGAHGHVGGRRWWTTRSVDRYCDQLEAGEDPTAGSEVLTTQERAVERLMLGLRLREGLHPGDLPPLDPLALEDVLNAGLLRTACGRLQATEDGWYLLDEAVMRLMP